MLTSSGQLPSLPEIGRPESYYAQQVHRADRIGNPHAREASKVGQYVTLAMDPRIEWEQKLRYFRHALRGHCVAPPLARDELWMFYAQLADLVRRHAGVEALRLASEQDDSWARQNSIGIPRQELCAEAAAFFRKLLGEKDECPDFLNHDDWEQLRILKNQWIEEAQPSPPNQ